MKTYKKIIAGLISTGTLFSCSGIQQASLAKSSINDKCRSELKKAVESILKEYDTVSEIGRNELGILRDSGGLVLRFPSTSISKYNGKEFHFILNDPAEPKLTLFRYTSGSVTKTSTMKKGLKSIELTECNCVKK